MNENIDLIKILKDCPKGWKFYSDIYNEVIFWGFSDLAYPIKINTKNHGVKLLSEKGEEIMGEGKCILFPSENQRDWNKFTAPWYKNNKNEKKFDLKTLKPFDKVIYRNSISHQWIAGFFSHYSGEKYYDVYICGGCICVYCIPYNDDTKRLVGTNEEAPDFYKYWED